MKQRHPDSPVPFHPSAFIPPRGDLRPSPDLSACDDSSVSSRRAARSPRPIIFPSFRRQKIRCERGLDFCLRTKNRRQPLDAGVCFPCHRGDDKSHRKISERRRHWSSQNVTATTTLVVAICHRDADQGRRTDHSGATKGAAK